MNYPVTHNPKEDAFYERIDPRTMTPEQLAQIAYEAWCDVMSCKTKTLTREWEALNDSERTAWRVAVVAVKVNILSGFTKVGEV